MDPWYDRGAQHFFWGSQIGDRKGSLKKLIFIYILKTDTEDEKSHDLRYTTRGMKQKWPVSDDVGVA